MGGDLVIRRQDLIENPTSRVPICFVLDCSPSMSSDSSSNQSPIDALNDGVRTFFTDIKDDEVARYSAEVAIVAFSGKAETILDFGSITRIDPPLLRLGTISGGTSIGSGVQLALTLLDARKNEYKDAGVDYYQPWLVIMTDGQPTDDTHVETSKEVSSRVMQKKMSVFPIGIGADADMGVLAMFSPKKPPLKLRGLRFTEFFEFISKSVAVISRSMPGEDIKLNTEGISSWAEL